MSTKRTPLGRRQKSHITPEAIAAFEKCPYPAGCFAAQQWKSDRDRRPEAFELYRALKKAAT